MKQVANLGASRLPKIWLLAHKQNTCMQLDAKLLFNSIYFATVKQDDLCPDLINTQKLLVQRGLAHQRMKLLKIITGIHEININK